MKNNQTKIVFDIAVKDNFIIRILMDRADITVDKDWKLVVLDLESYSDIYTEFKAIDFEKIDRIELQSELQSFMDACNKEFFELAAERNVMKLDDPRRIPLTKRMEELMF